MFGSVRVIIMAVLFFGIAGAGVYVMKLRSDNAILKANQVLLEQSVESQKQVIQKQQQDFSQILESNKTGTLHVLILRAPKRDTVRSATCLASKSTDSKSSAARAIV